MQNSGTGFIAIWTDVSRDNETDYLHWLTREHTEERISTDGFIAVRVFRALIDDARRYVMLYELETLSVVNSSAYLAKLNSPTPWTKKILSKPENFWRGGGCIVSRTGLGQGGYVGLVTMDEVPLSAQNIANALIGLDRICAVTFGETDVAATSVQTSEKKNRAIPDNSFGALLVIEATDETAIKTAFARLNQIAPGIARDSKRGADAYTTVFSIEKRQTGHVHPMHPGTTNS